MSNITNQTKSVNETITTRGLSIPALLLHFEGLTLFIAAVTMFIHIGGNGWLFALLILSPDLGMLGYLRSVNLGSLTYNAVHTYPVPALLILISLLTGSELGVQIGLIWFAHIGMDRTMGYGLKYPTRFKDTHLQHV